MVTTVSETIGSLARNLSRYTEDFDQTGHWTKFSSPTVANEGTSPLAPDGEATADKVTETTAGSALYHDYSSLTNTSIYCFSVFVYAGTGTTAKISVKNGSDEASIHVTPSDGSTSSSTTSGTNPWVHVAPADPALYTNATGWYRVEVGMSFLSASGSYIRAEIQPDSGGSNGYTYFWGAQFEEVEFPAPSVYQPQTGSSDSWTGTHASISAWLTAYNNTDLVSADTVYEGLLLDGDHVVDADVLEALNSTAAYTDATRYRILKPNGSRYNPAANTGPRIIVQWTTSTGTQEGLRITEDHFRVEGIGFICEDPRLSNGTGSSTRVAIQATGDDCLFDGVFIRIGETENRDAVPTDHYIYGVTVNSAARVSFFNCIVQGGSHGKGGTVGFYFDSGCSGGGVYNCAAYSLTRGAAPRGFWSLVSVATAPEIINCIAIDCTSSTGGDISGTWSRYSHNVTSDATAIAAITGGYNGDGEISASDPYSLAYQGVAAFIAPRAQDYRPPQSAVTVAAGSDESPAFALIGADEGIDIEGNTRTLPWSIGPYDDFSSRNTSAPTTYTAEVGFASLRHYRYLEAWLNASGGRAPNYENVILEAELYNDSGTVNVLGRTLRAYRTLSTASRFRRVKGGPDIHRWDPTVAAGAKYKGSGSSGAANLPVLDVYEDHFRMEGMAWEQSDTSANARRLVRLRGDGIQIDACEFKWTGGTAAQHWMVECRSSGALLTNVLAIGGAGATGGTIGIQLVECETTKVYHAVIDGIQGSGAAGDGLRGGAGIERCEAKNCIVTACDECFGGAEIADVEQSHNLSTDSTASGPGSQTSVTRTDVFQDPDGGNYELKIGSPAVDAGANLTAFLSSDFRQARRLAPFDCGIFDGVYAPILGGPPVTRNGLNRWATLWQIIREDGTAFHFTDANMPLTHAGRTYSPSDSLNASARRSESGLSETSVSYEGVVVSSGAITEEDLLAGKFRNALVIERLIDWSVPWATPILTKQYRLGALSFDSDTWTADSLGPAAQLTRKVGRNCSLLCPAVFGSAECGFDLTTETVDDVRIATVTDDRREFDANSSDVSGAKPDDHYGNGKVRWLTGDNVGVVSTIKTYTSANRTIVLVDRTPSAIQSSDTFQLTAGCRKRYGEDCVTKWSNGINFRGDPFIPGTDAAFQTLQR